MENQAVTFRERFDAVLVDAILVPAVQIPLMIGAGWLALHGHLGAVQQFLWGLGGWAWPVGWLLASAVGPWRTPGRRFMRLGPDPAGRPLALVRTGEHRGWFLRILGQLAGAGAALLLALLSFGWLFFVGQAVEAQTAAARGHLNALRSGLVLYADSHANRFPARLDDPAFVKDSLGGTFPSVRLTCVGHAESAAIETYPFVNRRGEVDPAALKDTGHWLYDARTGVVIIDCTHPSPSWPRVDAIWKWER